ncbi:peptidoglycan-binding protein [Flavobacterium cheongpyeongense]|uniref:Peptidoglycan-binding protein n=1 Tax=Flavobacterium cheongpyeongense TaxID=2212651 RepID=A0A2V4BZB3_9FLAO|nr:DUF4157 domain-containing protein [Flavobacterium cheongpyeongense]PXY39334.1 peptidoglycan-binding protein [Flavobacterium cheongpyeongense]
MRAFEQRKKDSTASTTFFGPKIQKKLKTGTAGDKYELEADSVADKVVNNTPAGGGLLQSKEQVQQKPVSETISTIQAKDMKEEEKPVQKKSDKKEEEKPVQKKEKEEEKPVQKKSDKEEEKPIQAKCADCEKEDNVQKKSDKEEEKPIQKKGKNTESEIQDNALEGKLDSSKGGGTGLDKKTKNEMESGFGTDFSNVKIHTDARAVQMSQELGAQAFTNGNDVYFNQGKYNPDSREGKHLLAHELTHTVQQTGAKQKSGTIQKSSIENHPEDLQAERPENPQFRGNPPLEKANDNQMLISIGQKGQYVAELQQGLLEAGQSLPKFGADGDFGTETRNAVIGFQTDNGLNKIDGLVGPETMGALDNKLVGLKGGKKDECEDTVTFQKGPFLSEEKAGFFSTAQCPKVTITIDAVAQIVNFHNCASLDISIDHVQRTRRTIPIGNNGKGHFKETFTLKHHKDIHKLFFTMPADCKGMGDTFTVSGTIHRHS